MIELKFRTGFLTATRPSGATELRLDPYNWSPRAPTEANIAGAGHIGGHRFRVRARKLAFRAQARRFATGSRYAMRARRHDRPIPAEQRRTPAPRIVAGSGARSPNRDGDDPPEEDGRQSASIAQYKPEPSRIFVRESGPTHLRQLSGPRRQLQRQLCRQSRQLPSKWWSSHVTGRNGFYRCLREQTRI